MRYEDITNVVYDLEQNFLSSVGTKGRFDSLKEAEEKLSRLKKESYGPEHYLENLLEFKNHGILPWEEAEGKERKHKLLQMLFVWFCAIPIIFFGGILYPNKIINPYLVY